MAIYDIDSTTLPDTNQTLNYIVMEYVRGVDLDEYLRDQKPEMAGQIRLAEKIAVGLAAAHQMNIVHRDIKPGNIIVNAEGEPKILDFGLAKAVGTGFSSDSDVGTDTISQELTQAGKIVGTVKYMSPEQVHGKPVDSRSDIFSFGILMYNLFTGAVPFEGQSRVSTMAKILEASYEPATEKCEGMPFKLGRIIDKCLHKKPGDRYQDSRDLVVDLRNLRRQFDSGVTESITGRTDRLPIKKTVTFNLKWPGAGAVAVVALLLFYMLGGFDLFMSESGKTGVVAHGNALAIIGFENKTGDAELDWMETGLPELLLTDLSRNREVKIISQQRILDCFETDRSTEHTFTEYSREAEKLGAGRVLTGAFYKLGDKLRFDARVMEIGTDRILLSEKVVGDDPFALVNSLTARLAASLDFGAMVETGEVAQTTPEAFKLFHLGMELFWTNDFDSAIVMFHEAVNADTSFAMPYMRIGMANQFLGRPSESVEYFKMANLRRDRMPLRDRQLLDVYVNTWVDQQYDHAFTKLTAMVRDYPEDAEIRTIFALFVNSFRSDTTEAFAHLDTVLTLYPANAFAIRQYANLEQRNGNLERATELIEELTRLLPNSISSFSSLALYRQRQGRWDEALSLAEDLYDRFGQDSRAIHRLISITTHLRRFSEARQWAEKFKQTDPNDRYILTDYHGYLLNLDSWEGKFQSSLDHRGKQLELACRGGDTALVFALLNQLSDNFRRLEMPDSMLVYETEGYRWAVGFNTISYPLRMIQYDPSLEPEVRPILDSSLEDFRARTPKEFWPVAQSQEMLFNGYLNHDTALLISSNRLLIATIASQVGDNEFELGRLLVLTGQYEEGIELLSLFLDGPFRSNNAYRFLVSTYLVGRAREGLGRTEEAAEHYREVLKYWDKADIQIQPIVDSRRRLARLQG